jgi:hypothetical protein
VSEVSSLSQTFGLALDGDESRGPTFETLAEAAHAAVEAVGPNGGHYTALVLRFELVDRHDPPSEPEVVAYTSLDRVSRVDEHGAPT